MTKARKEQPTSSLNLSAADNTATATALTFYGTFNSPKSAKCLTCGGETCPHCGKALPEQLRTYQPIWIAPWQSIPGYPWWQIYPSVNTSTITTPTLPSGWQISVHS